ncbi:MAG: hypothetical protein DSY57_03210, partial [Desulfobulbus sp.]
MHILNRFIKLAQVFIEGRGVPFLGAGISMSARVPPGQVWKPTVSWMTEALLIRIQEKFVCMNPGQQENMMEQLHTALGHFPDREQEFPGSTEERITRLYLENMAQWRESLLATINNRLGMLCQAVTSLGLLSHDDIVYCLKIHEYYKLGPTPAHYYIALLVHENLLNEAITTNYD